MPEFLTGRAAVLPDGYYNLVLPSILRKRPAVSVSLRTIGS